MIDITGLKPAAVLAALYNASRPQGMGFLQYDKEPMKEEEAAKLLESHGYFDYLKGRVMKLAITSVSEFIEERLYDRDNGQGAAKRAVDALRASGSTNDSTIRAAHSMGKLSAAFEAHMDMNTPSTIETKEGMTEIKMHMDDVKEHLEPVIKKALEK
jgi:hypothetical protein